METRKWVRLILGLFGLLAGVVSWAVHRNVAETSDLLAHGKSESCLEAPVAKSAKEMKVCEDNSRGYSVRGRNRIPYQQVVTSTQSNEVCRAFVRLAEAYTNMQVEVFRRRMTQLPDSAVKMPNIYFIGVKRPLVDIFSDCFLRTDRLEDFAEESAFARFAEMNIEVAKFLGNMDLERGDICVELCVLEKNTLRQLIRYREKFRTGGCPGLEKIADRYIEDWRRQIDSERGFTRRYMWFQVDLQWDHIEEGSWSLKQLVDFIRSYAVGLVDLGHTPKWIEEFKADEEFLQKKDVPFD